MVARVLSIVLLVLVSDAALACAVCMGGQDDPTGDAFFKATVLMSLVPLGMISGTLFYIVRAVRKLDRDRNVAP